MYRSNLSNRDRGGALVAVAAIHAALFFAFLNISGRMDLPAAERVLQVIDIDVLQPPPTPPPPPPPPQRRQEKPEEEEGGSPANIRSQATPVVAPKPQVEPQRPNPIVVTETPRQGAAPTQGAADVRGPGTGAGGTGKGTGTGSGGGPGGGGEGGIAVDARLITPRLMSRDYSPELLRIWPRRTPVFVALRIAANGTVIECKINRSSGVPAIDAETCNLAHVKFRFRPARNRFGQPVASWRGYVQEPLDR